MVQSENLQEDLVVNVYKDYKPAPMYVTCLLMCVWENCLIDLRLWNEVEEMHTLQHLKFPSPLTAKLMH